MTGLIRLAGALDRERVKTHELRIEAYDLGVPTPLQSDLDLVVYVVNVNDHLPQFIVDQFTVNFTENRPPATQARTIIKTVDLDEEELDDLKLDVCYYIGKKSIEKHF